MFDPELLRRVGRVATFLEPYLVSLLFGFVAAAILTRVSMRLARFSGAMAHPDHRSLHEKPTPRLGGLGLGGGFLIGLALLELWPKIDARLFPIAAPLGFVLPLAIGAGIFLLLGLADDLFGMNPWIKLFLQIFLASYFLNKTGQVDAAYNFGLLLLQLPGAKAAVLTGKLSYGLVVLAGFFLSTLWIVLFLNMANFLDGADGQAATFGIVQALFCAALFATGAESIRYLGEGYHGAFFVCLHLLALGACLGFLLYNLPTADTFLGDCGSHFLGFLWGATTLRILAEPSEIVATPLGRVLSPANGPFQLAGVLVAMSPFLFDFLFTLTRRFIQGHAISRPHRDHLYQRLALTGLSHRTLLCLHLPYYLFNATAGFVLFHDAFGDVAKYVALATAVGSWIAYARFVAWREAGTKAGSGGARGGVGVDTPPPLT
jgi:UDP-GlcNAc:undecaprenyl-phosphate GlcNAc-1-phosphate transferase